MNGIFGYVGNGEHIEKIRSGLSHLRDRGGSGTGIALKCNNELYYAGSVNAQGDGTQGCTASIAVACNEPISAPACSSAYAVVCDGEITNKSDLLRRGGFAAREARTDEMLLSLLSAAGRGDKTDIAGEISTKIKGSPTFAFICADEDAIYLSKGNEPVFIGMGDDGMYIASELAAISGMCEKYIMLSDGDTARITQARASIYDCKGHRAKRSVQAMPSDIREQAEGSDDIFCCPMAIKDCCSAMISDNELMLDNLKISRHMLERADRIIITGSGSAFNAARASAYNYELLTDIEAMAIPSSELMENVGIISRDTLVIAVSAGGEDMSTITAVKRAKYNDARVVGITAAEHSYLAMLCDSVIPLPCCAPRDNEGLTGFQTEYLVLSLLGVYLGYKRGYITDIHMSVTLKMAQLLCGKVASAIKPRQEPDDVYERICASGSIAVCGHTVDYAVAAEVAGALRTSGHCAYAARLDDMAYSQADMVIAVISNECYAQREQAMLEKIKSRCTHLTICTTENTAELMRGFEDIIAFGDSVALFNPIILISGIYRIIAPDEATEELESAS